MTLALTALLVAAAVVEVAIRTTGLGVHDVTHEMTKYANCLVWDVDGDYFRHPADASAVLRGVRATFNSFGMRDEEPRVPKPPGVFRILCLGDSVTFGQGVAQDAIWPRRLRALLADRGVDVVAAGVGGWNTIEEERFLARHIARLAPDLVVLLYVTNDNEPLDPFMVAQHRSARWTTKLGHMLVLRSRLVEWAAFVYRTRVAGTDWEALRHLADRRKEREAWGEPFAPTDPGWIASREALGRLVGLTRAHGAELVIMLFNLGGGGSSGPARVAARALARLQEFAAEMGVPVEDTAPFFAGRDAATLVNQPIRDPHPNAAGHALLAAGVARQLEERGLIPASRSGP